MSSSGGSSRRRNCDACVKSKRRCDKRQPACSRCVKQRYPCVYGRRDQMETAFGDSGDAPFNFNYLADPTINPDTFTPAMLGTDLHLTPSTLQLNSDFSSLLASVPGTNSFLPDPWPAQFTEVASAPHEKSLIRKDYTKMEKICYDYAPWQLTDPSSKSAFTVSFVKKFHVAFAHSHGTPYIHRYLYKDNMPRWILQAYTLCFLYANQTATNRGIVLRVLHTNVAELKAAASNMTLMPQEKLARVHALMFYQTIRMFDGDITLGQQVDDDFALLESWNHDLCKIRDNCDDIINKGESASEHPPESWERWIFAESLRRTCIMCFCIRRFWEILKSRAKLTLALRYLLAGHSPGHLWNANNSFDFFRAWKEKPFYIISSLKFEDFLKTGTGDDLDEFAFYFLTLYFGVNEIKTFCYETSGRLLTI
ncbi:hypothetical protein F5Y12DRAFT_372727 [Xylaria sp. FL1777]|nr:hypothetical protein F5Y12DRAFT_372727 [Xylaria sp. FL1777]